MNCCRFAAPSPPLAFVGKILDNIFPGRCGAVILLFGCRPLFARPPSILLVVISCSHRTIWPLLLNCCLGDGTSAATCLETSFCWPITSSPLSFMAANASCKINLPRLGDFFAAGAWPAIAVFLEAFPSLFAEDLLPVLSNNVAADVGRGFSRLVCVMISLCPASAMHLLEDALSTCALAPVVILKATLFAEGLLPVLPNVAADNGLGFSRPISLLLFPPPASAMSLLEDVVPMEA